MDDDAPPIPAEDPNTGGPALDTGQEGPVRDLWEETATPRGLVAAFLVLGILDATQLYIFEHFRGEALSFPGALARNGTFWLVWIPFGWGLLSWLSAPVEGVRGRRRLLVHGAMALLVGILHVAAWVVVRELVAHQHFRLTSYPYLVAKFLAPRLGVDLVVYLGLHSVIARKKAGGSDPAPADAVGTTSPSGGNTDGHDRLKLQTGGQTYFVDPDRLEWVEAAGDYMRLHLGDDDLLVRITLKGLHRRLDSRFVRVSRSALVRLDRIREIRSGGRDRHEIVLESGARVTLTAGYRDHLGERLEISL